MVLLGRGTSRQPQHTDAEHYEQGTYHADNPVVSSTTLVALTVAIAGEPTSKPSSCTASVEISDTTRNGPHCNSTFDIITSDSFLVTRPVSLLRADEASSPGT